MNQLYKQWPVTIKTKFNVFQVETPFLYDSLRELKIL